MLRHQLTRCSRVGFFHDPKVTLAARLFIPRFFGTTRNNAIGWPWRRASAQETLPDPTPEDMKYIGQVIIQGDRLAGVKQRAQSSTNRRALIVAPRYEDHARAKISNLQRMPNTVRDARLIHETLVRRGYNPGDIRILADGYPQYNGLTDPSRQNILDSLKWLVDGAQKDDYRFFYFSGHGERLDSELGQGKQARKVNENSKADSNDTERYAYGNEPSKWPPAEWPLKQLIPEKQLVYYKESIATTLSTNPNYDSTSGINYRIEDSELNTLFAQLPEGSNLTCVIDCCASGRIINNSVKVAGAGFRGAKTQNIIDKLKDARDWLKQKTGLSEIEMEETIPEVERNMDRIRANVLTWAACHQRQDSVPYVDNLSGLFTRVWTEALDKDTSRTMLIGELYDSVSSKTLELGKKKNAWQYVQLWTSMGREDRAITSRLMKNRVTI